MFRVAQVLQNFKRRKNEEEKAMGRFMKTFEDIMIAVAFAEAGISVSIFQPETGLRQDMGERVWAPKL